MAYITKSNKQTIYTKIANKVVYLDESYNNIYHHRILFLTEGEQQQLLRIKALMEKFEFYIRRYFCSAKKKDTHTFVWEGRNPAYHSRIDCEALTSDFKNYEVPVEIQERGDYEVKKFRRWFEQNEHLLEDHHVLFLTKMEATFMLRNPPNIREIEKNNSGVDEINDFAIETLTTEIDALITEAEVFYKQHRDLRPMLDRIPSRNNLKKASRAQNVLVQEWHSLKKELKNKLITYYQLHHNPDLKLGKTLLSTLGFVECRRCGSSHKHNAANDTSLFKLPNS